MKIFFHLKLLNKIIKETFLDDNVCTYIIIYIVKHILLKKMHQHIRDIKLIIFLPFGLTYVLAFHLRSFIEVKLNRRPKMKREPSVENKKERSRNLKKIYIIRKNIVCLKIILATLSLVFTQNSLKSVILETILSKSYS